jgi:hypothetical protein
MPRVIIPVDVTPILEEQLYKLYAVLEEFNKKSESPPHKLTTEIAELEARIYEDSNGTLISED